MQPEKPDKARNETTQCQQGNTRTRGGSCGSRDRSHSDSAPISVRFIRRASSAGSVMSTTHAPAPAHGSSRSKHCQHMLYMRQRKPTHQSSIERVAVPASSPEVPGTVSTIRDSIMGAASSVDDANRAIVSRQSTVTTTCPHFSMCTSDCMMPWCTG
jgi:hypothetical protein